MAKFYEASNTVQRLKNETEVEPVSKNFKFSTNWPHGDIAM